MPFVDRLDVDRGPQHCLYRTDLDGGLKVISVPDKPVVGQDIDLDEQVTVGCTIITCFTIPLHAKSHTVIDSCRDMDGYFPFHSGMTRTPAFFADFFRNFSFSAALSAGHHPDELPEG